MLTLARRLFAPTAVASVVLLSSSWLAPLPGGASTRPNPHRLVKLSPAPEVPASSHRVGHLPAKSILHLEIGLLPRDPLAFQGFLDGVTTPGSSTFRHYLAPGAYASRFGPTPQSIAPLVAALRSSGLTVRPLDRARQDLKITGTAESVESFFHTGLSTFAATNGTTDFANTGALRVEASLRPLIAGVTGLTSFGRRTPAVAHRAPLAIGGTAPSCTSASSVESAGMGVSTTQLASAYGLNALYGAQVQGAGATVALYELSAFRASDVTTYKSCYGISPTVKIQNVDGGPTAYSVRNAADATEPTLDLEEMLSIAPKATYIVYQGPNASARTPSGPNDVLATIAAADVAQVVSTSWGLCEADNPDPGGVVWEHAVFQQMAAQGQTFIAASGDNGTADCAGDGSTPANTATSVDDPASQPYVTGVGATRLLSSSPLSQTAWGSGTLTGGASGGGVSSIWSRPSWQHMASSDPVVNGSTHRLVPDVSLNGDPKTGVLIYQFDQGGWFSVGGTSAASPLLASLIALADSNCRTSVGFLNPQLYALSASSPTDFSDTTTGTNSVGTGTTYVAQPGYDLATGLGSPLGSLLTGLCTAAPSATQTSVLAGKLTTITAHVAAPVQLQAGDTVSVSLPSGDTVPTNSASVTATANGSTGPISLVGSSVGSLSTTRNTYSFTVHSALAAGSLLAFTLTNVLNRVTQTPAAMVVSSSVTSWINQAAQLPALTPVSKGWTSSDLTATQKALRSSTSAGDLSGSQVGTSLATLVNAKLVIASGSTPNLVATTVATASLPTASGKLVGQVAIGKLDSQLVVATTTTTGHLIVTHGATAKAKWSPVDVTTALSLPETASGACLSIAKPLTTSIAVGAVRLSNGHLLQFQATSSAAKAFTVTDLTALTGATLSGTPSCRSSGGTFVVAYRADSGDLMVLTSSVTSAAASLVDVTSTSGASSLANSPIGLLIQNGQVLVSSVSTDGKIYLSTSVVGSSLWTATNLSAAQGLPSGLTNPVLAATGAKTDLFAVDTSNHLVLVTNNGSGGTWNAYDLSAAYNLGFAGSGLKAAVAGTAVSVSWLTASHHLGVAASSTAI